MPSESKILSGMQDDPAPDDEDIATEAAAASVGEVPDSKHSVEELDDGGAIIRMEDEKDTKRSAEFYSNLADDMEHDVLRDLASKLLDLYDLDLEDRTGRDKQQSEALRQTGFTGETSRGAEFDGSSSATYPLVSEVAIDFSARAIKELWPAGGPAKSEILGEPNPKKEEKADRKAKYLNWQLRVQMPNTRNELEKILTQVPMGGVQYSKLYWDSHKRRPVHEPVWVDEIILPGSATSFYGSPRKAHRQTVDKFTFDYRVRTGVYRDVDVITVGGVPDPTRSEGTNDKIEGVSSNVQNPDGERLVIEFDVHWLLPDDKRGVTDVEESDDGPAPYLVSIDHETREVLSVYRNWDENDEFQDPLVHIVEWPFIPWRGAMAIGVPQVLGGIAIATTGALRSLLDSALINNFPGGVRLKSGPMGGQSVNVQGEQTNEIEGGIGQDDIRQMFMPVPVNPTSAVLMQLLEFLVQAGKDVVKTTLDEANDNANVPVGTIMARIEQQMVVFSAIHARLHDAMGKLLKVLHRLDATYLEDSDVLDQTGEQMVWKADFDAPDDVVPVSDPEIFSELQRVEQGNMLISRATAAPDLYDRRKVEEHYLKVMKVPNGQQYLNPKPEATPMNAVNENVAAALGRPITAYPDQDHLAHIQTHLKFLEDPCLGQNPMIGPTAANFLLQNIKEHLLFWYASSIANLAESEYGQGPEGFAELMTIKEASITSALDGLFAAAANNIHAQTQAVFGGMMPILQQIQQMLKQSQPPPPMDPSAVAQQKIAADKDIAAQKIQSEQQIAAQEAALKGQDMQQTGQQFQSQLAQDAQQAAQDAQVKTGIASQNNQTKVQTTGMTDDTKKEITGADNDVALQITGAKIAEAERAGKANGLGNLTNGEGVQKGGGPNPKA